MKNKLKRYLSEFRQGVVRVVRRYPVETALQTVLTIFVVWWIEADEFRLFPPECLWVFPLFWAGALIINTLSGRSAWRRVYWVIWTPLVPLLVWPGLKEWIATDQFAVTLGVLIPLALLLCRRARDNRRFAADALVYLRSAVIAAIFANVALGLFESILWSTAYIFGFDSMRWVEHLAEDVIPVAGCFAAPLLMLLLLDRWEEREFRLARVGEVLVNWLVTPALVIYAVILHLYAARILLTWSLPRGGVAYLVFGFILTAFLMRILRELVERRTAEWFYSRFSAIMLTPIVLFWVGVVRRVGEYGLTAPRVYLLVCGVVMTLAVLIFLLRAGRYAWLCAAAFVLFAAVAYVPFLSPDRIGVHSQRARFYRLARSLELVDADGRLRSERVPLADTVRWRDYREAFESMAYVLREDTTFRQRLGIAPDESTYEIKSRLLPGRLRNRTEHWYDPAEEVVLADLYSDVSLPSMSRVEADAAYPQLYANMSYWGVDRDGCRLDNDTLRIRLNGTLLLEISGRELVRRQIQATGTTPEQLSDLEDEQTLRFLDYRDERVRVLFSSLRIERADSTGYGLCGATVELLWTR